MRDDRVEQPRYDVGFTDFHSHMIPRMDDGSRSVEMSLEMIRESEKQNVRRIVLTPHFYPSQSDPESFLKKRSKQLDALTTSLGDSETELIPGAEVMYFEGLVTMRDLPKMRIGSSPAILIEMPFRKWTERMLSDIIEINRRAGFSVVLAHIERYLHYINEATVRRLVSEGVLIQANATFFIGRFTRSRAIRMLRAGLIHFIGSDSHNMSDRPPNIAEAMSLIEKKCGIEAVREITDHGIMLLQTEVSDDIVMYDEEMVL